MSSAAKVKSLVLAANDNLRIADNSIDGNDDDSITQLSPRTKRKQRRSKEAEQQQQQQGGQSGGINGGDDGGDYDDNDGGEDDDDDDEEVTRYRDPPEGQVRLRPSRFRGIPATVFIDYPPELGVRRSDTSVLVDLGEGPKRKRMQYSSYWERMCVRNAFLRAGFAKVGGGRVRAGVDVGDVTCNKV